MNRLTALGGGLGLLLLVLAGWTRFRYGAGSVGSAAAVAVIAAALALAPPGVVWGRFLLRRRLDDPATTDGAWRVSGDPVAAPQACLDAAQAAIATGAARLDAEETTFAGDRGLMIHDGLQVGFVRITQDDRLVVGGSRVLVPQVCALLDDVDVAVTLNPTDRNPFVEPAPVRGAPRVAFAVLILVGAVAGVAVAADGAYDADAYNPAEKTVLMGIDIRTAVDPGHSSADGAIDRAAFMTDVLAEEATEIRWANDTNPAVHAEQAVVVDRDVRANLERADARDLTPAQRDRTTRIRERSVRARRDVIRAIDDIDAPDSTRSRLRASRTALQTVG